MQATALLKAIRDFICGAPRDEFTWIYQHATLGKLALSEDGSWWEGTYRITNGCITVLIAGNRVPDEALLEYAADLVSHFDEIEARIGQFLAQEKTRPRFAKFSSEIDLLKISSFEHLWPEHPSTALIGFTGGIDGRDWYCWLEAGVPTDMGFDA